MWHHFLTKSCQPQLKKYIPPNFRKKTSSVGPKVKSINPPQKLVAYIRRKFVHYKLSLRLMTSKMCQQFILDAKRRILAANGPKTSGWQPKWFFLRIFLPCVPMNKSQWMDVMDKFSSSAIGLWLITFNWVPLDSSSRPLELNHGVILVKKKIVMEYERYPTLSCSKWFRSLVFVFW